jgi:hypothetical protein
MEIGKMGKTQVAICSNDLQKPKTFSSPLAETYGPTTIAVDTEQAGQAAGSRVLQIG